MALNAQLKQEIIESFQHFKGDTGSSEVQIALLSKKIERLTEHLRAHPHDNHSRRGLLKMVSSRRKLLDYLKRVKYQAYLKLIETLGLRR